MGLDITLVEAKERVSGGMCVVGANICAEMLAERFGLPAPSTPRDRIPGLPQAAVAEPAGL